MPDSFNAYQKWLGIPPKDQPANHYRLLGIELFESDADIIAHAADRQMAHVRTFQAGEHGAISQTLLNEIAAARICLLGAENKAAYDRKLKAELAPRRTAERAAAVRRQPAAFHVETAGDTRAAARRRRPKRLWLLSTMLGLAGLAVVILAVMFDWGGGKPEVSQRPSTPAGEEPGRPPPTSSRHPAPSPPAPDHQPDDGPDRPALDSPSQTDPGLSVPEVQPDVQPNVDLKPAEPDSADSPLVEGPAVAALPPSADPPQPVLHTSSRITTSVPVRLWVMNDDDQRTPKVFVGGAPVPQSARFNRRGWTFEFTLNPSDAVVVETSDRGQGMLAYVLADEQGTLLAYSKEAVAVHDGGQRADAFRGGDVSGAALARAQGSRDISPMRSQSGFPEAVADDWCSVWLPDNETGTILAHVFTAGPSAAATPAGAAAVEVAPEGPPKPPPPSVAEQRAAQREIKTIHQDEFAAARSPDQKSALAETLLEHARTARDDPATQFVLLCQARDLAAEAGNHTSAMRIIDEVAGAFEVDALQMKAELLTEVSRVGRSNSLRREIAAASLDLSEVAARHQRFDVAGRLATRARSLTMRLSDVELRKRARDADTRIKKLARGWQEINRARETLAADPDDPDANVTYGKYVCLEEDDWPRGLAMLARGNHPQLRAAARLDLAAPEEPEAQVAAGDTWYELARADESLSPFQARARHWYAQALPGATTLAKAKIEKRLSELGGSPPGAAAPATPPSPGGGTPPSPGGGTPPSPGGGTLPSPSGETHPKTTLVNKAKDAASRQAVAAALNMRVHQDNRVRALQYLSKNYPADVEVAALMKVKAAQATADYHERTVAIKYLCEHCGDDAEVVRFMKQKALSRTSDRHERELATKHLCRHLPQDDEVFGIMMIVTAARWPDYHEREAAVAYLCKNRPEDAEVLQLMKAKVSQEWADRHERQTAIAYLCKNHPEDAEVLQLMKAKVSHEWADTHERQAAISFLTKKHPDDPDLPALMQEVADDPKRDAREVKLAQAYLRGR